MYPSLYHLWRSCLRDPPYAERAGHPLYTGVGQTAAGRKYTPRGPHILRSCHEITETTLYTQCTLRDEIKAVSAAPPCVLSSEAHKRCASLAEEVGPRLPIINVQYHCFLFFVFLSSFNFLCGG